MNIEKLNQELSKLENDYNQKNGDIVENVKKQFNDSLHTMQMKEDYENLDNFKTLLSIAKEFSGYEAVDLSDLEKYERLLFGKQGDN